MKKMSSADAFEVGPQLYSDMTSKSHDSLHRRRGSQPMPIEQRTMREPSSSVENTAFEMTDMSRTSHTCTPQDDAASPPRFTRGGGYAFVPLPTSRSNSSHSISGILGSPTTLNLSITRSDYNCADVLDHLDSSDASSEEIRRYLPKFGNQAEAKRRQLLDARDHEIERLAELEKTVEEHENSSSKKLQMMKDALERMESYSAVDRGSVNKFHSGYSEKLMEMNETQQRLSAMEAKVRALERKGVKADMDEQIRRNLNEFHQLKRTVSRLDLSSQHLKGSVSAPCIPPAFCDRAVKDLNKLLTDLQKIERWLDPSKASIVHDVTRYVEVLCPILERHRLPSSGKVDDIDRTIVPPHRRISQASDLPTKSYSENYRVVTSRSDTTTGSNMRTAISLESDTTAGSPPKSRPRSFQFRSPPSIRMKNPVLESSQNVSGSPLPKYYRQFLTPSTPSSCQSDPSITLPVRHTKVKRDIFGSARYSPLSSSTSDQSSDQSSEKSIRRSRKSRSSTSRSPNRERASRSRTVHAAAKRSQHRQKQVDSPKSAQLSDAKEFTTSGSDEDKSRETIEQQKSKDQRSPSTPKKDLLSSTSATTPVTHSKRKRRHAPPPNEAVVEESHFPEVYHKDQAIAEVTVPDTLLDEKKEELPVKAGKKAPKADILRTSSTTTPDDARPTPQAKKAEGAPVAKQADSSKKHDLLADKEIEEKLVPVVPPHKDPLASNDTTTPDERSERIKGDASSSEGLSADRIPAEAPVAPAGPEPTKSPKEESAETIKTPPKPSEPGRQPSAAAPVKPNEPADELSEVSEKPVEPIKEPTEAPVKPVEPAKEAPAAPAEPAQESPKVPEKPVEITKEPPVAAADAEKLSETPPVQVAEKLAEKPQEPDEPSTEAPKELADPTKTPVESTKEAPVKSAELPAEAQKEPALPTEPNDALNEPANEPSAPSEPSDAQKGAALKEVADAPKASIEPAKEPTNVSEEPSAPQPPEASKESEKKQASPNKPGELPKESTEAPKEPVEQKVESTEVPSKTAEAAKETIEAPKEPVELAKEPVVAQDEPAEAPIQSSEAAKGPAAPKESVETPKEQSEAPKEAPEIPKASTEANKGPAVGQDNAEAQKQPNETPKAPAEAAKEPADAPKEPSEATKEADEALKEAARQLADLPMEKALIGSPKTASLETRVSMSDSADGTGKPLSKEEVEDPFKVRAETQGGAGVEIGGDKKDAGNHAQQDDQKDPVVRPTATDSSSATTPTIDDQETTM